MSEASKEKHQNRNKKCQQCGKLALKIYAEKIPLCVECYLKIAQAEFLEQQSMHNKMSWLAAQLNLTEQHLHQGMGGLLPLKQMVIPQPPSAGVYYTDSSVKISDSVIGVFNQGTLTAINTSIEVLQKRGDKQLAALIKELLENVAESKDIQDKIKTEISELLQLVSTEITLSDEKRDKGVIKKVLEKLNTLIPTTAAAWIIWEKLLALLKPLYN
ncbi:hypothetical protein ACFLVH_01950 [Chloroflexota bacterium]